MKINIAACLLLSVFLLFTQPEEENFPDLYNLLQAAKYEILIEKALATINNPANKLNSAQRAELFYLIASGYEKLNNFQMAQNYYNRSVSAAPGTTFAGNSLYRIALLAADSSSRNNLLKEFLNKFPSSQFAADALLELIRYHLRFNNYQQIYDLVKKTALPEVKSNQFYEVRMIFAISCYQIKRYFEAVQSLIKIEQNNPDTLLKPLYLKVAGNIYYENLNFKKAGNYFIRLLNVFPQSNESFEAVSVLADVLDKEKKPFLAAIFLISVLKQRESFPLLIKLVNLLDQLPEEDLDKIKSHSIRFADRSSILKYIQEKSPLYEHRREATIMLSAGKEIQGDFLKTVDFFIKSLSEKRDSAVEAIFQKKIEDYLNRKQINAVELLLIWNRLKYYKSLLNSAILTKFATELYNSDFFLYTEEILQHLLNYKIYRESWEFADFLYLKIDLKLNRLDKITQQRLKVIRNESELLYLYLNALRLNRKDQELTAILLQYQPPAKDDFYSDRILKMKLMTLKEAGRIEEALTLLNKLLKSSFFSEQEMLSLKLLQADCYFLLNDLENALSSYQKLKEIKELPQDWILFQMIIISQKKGDTEQVKLLFKQFQKQFPDSYFLDKLSVYVR